MRFVGKGPRFFVEPLVLILSVIGDPRLSPGPEMLQSFNLAFAAPQPRAESTMETRQFGSLEDGTRVEMFVLKNAHGATAKVITYGATLTELWMPDRSGNMGDVVLGFDTLQGYLGKHPWFGATVGRVANRIANGKFTLDGKEYSIEINDPPNSLHSGSHDLSRVIWKAEPLHEPSAAAVRFTYFSPDGDEGFPGNLSVSVTYRLTNDNELKLEYFATTDKPTPVSLTNHTYFNLGDAQSDILGEVLYLSAHDYTPIDDTLIPTGEIRRVKNTPFDFMHPTAIGARIDEIKGRPGGYDHNFVLGDPGKLKLAARVVDPTTRRQMEVSTTEPGVQFYSGNFLDGTLRGKRGVSYKKRSALCLETQHYPDSVNHANFPSVILRPGDTYRSETIYKFSSK